MIGLAYILFFVVYGYLSIKVVKYAANLATDLDRNPKPWAFLAGFVMYNLVFWDLIPVYATHAYYCAKLSGLTVYKTPEEWKAENPGVAGHLSSAPPQIIANPDGYTIPLNQRFDRIVKYEKLPLFHWVLYRRVVDRKTGEKLVEERDVTLRMQNFVVSGVVSVRNLKIWLGKADRCHVNDSNRSRWLYMGKSFSDYSHEFKKLGREGDE